MDLQQERVTLNFRVDLLLGMVSGWPARMEPVFVGCRDGLDKAMVFEREW